MSGLHSSVHSLWRLLRPFTLLPPLVGMLSGAAAAVGVRDGGELSLETAGRLGLGALMAAILNAASNVINQVYDLDIDRINRPERPLPSGQVNSRTAGRLALFLYALALLLAFQIQPAGRPELGIIVLVTSVLTWLYSAPPLRARNHWWLAPWVIAIPRGGLLKVAGWACVASVFDDREPWVIAAVFFVFVLGCAPTKDFGDMAGDRAGGASSLPLRFGPLRAAWIIAPFFVLPWVALMILPRIDLGGRPLLGVEPVAAVAVGGVLAFHGATIAAQLICSTAKAGGSGRAQWRNLYLLMMEAQLGLAILYLGFGNG